MLDLPGGHGKSPIGPSYVRSVPAASDGEYFEVEEFKGGRHIYPPGA
jgi:lysine 2,3-aminomutase